jgi:DNA-binding CsgD family transcriptional regulator/protein-L-isoaspartate O-methyltransferase
MSFEALKARQSEAWGSAPWEPMAARIAAIHDHLVARLAPGRGERWLDVGTGAVALRAARAGARVTGVDLSPVMVDTARRLAREQGSGFRFDVGDAESLPYEDASFDVVASALGVFLAPDHAAAGRELAPVCRAGGRLGVVAWRADPEAERMHAPFWPAREPGAGDRRDWGREEYLAELLGQDFEPTFGLSARELEVLTLVAQGHSNQRIAEILVLSKHTVRRHVANILKKMDVPSRTAAAALATRENLL